MLIFQEVTPGEAYSIWQDFADDIGLEHMRQTYGRYWPRHPVENESVYKALNEKNERVGWVAIRPDPVDPIVWQCSGVFEKFRGNSFSKTILQWSALKSHELWNVEAMLFEISNHVLLQPYIQYHIKRIFEKRIPGEYAAGFINTPDPGYTIFGIKLKANQAASTNIPAEIIASSNSGFVPRVNATSIDTGKTLTVHWTADAEL